MYFTNYETTVATQVMGTSFWYHATFFYHVITLVCLGTHPKPTLFDVSVHFSIGHLLPARAEFSTNSVVTGSYWYFCVYWTYTQLLNFCVHVPI